MAPRAFGLTKMNLKMPEIHLASCNIGEPEVGRRKVAAIFSGVITLLTAGFLLFFDSPRELRLVIFGPVMFVVVTLLILPDGNFRI